MPSTSAKQAKFMKAVANNPKFAKKVGVAQSVGKDFEMADKKMKKFNSGGAAKKPKPPMPNEPVTGGPGTVPLTPERKKFLDELRRRQGEGAKPPKKPGMKEGGKVAGKTKGAAKTRKFAMGGAPAQLPGGAPARLAGNPAAANRPLTQTQAAGRMPGYMGNLASVGSVQPSEAASTTKYPSKFAEHVAGVRAKQAAYVARRDAAKRPGTPVEQGMSRGALSGLLGRVGQSATRGAPAPRMGGGADSVIDQYTRARDAGPQSAMKKGGKIMKKDDKTMKKSDKAGRALVKKSADTMGRAMMKKAGGGKCYAKGGSVSSRADGVAKKGKTNTKMVAMRKGGSC